MPAALAPHAPRSPKRQLSLKGRSSPLIRLGLALAVLGSLAGTSPRLQAGDPPLVIYTMNERGLVSIGGTVIENLKSKYDPATDPPGNPEQQWVDLAVDGGDRWALRVDGAVHQNGKKLHTLPFENTLEGASTWQRLTHSDALYALRSDGLLAADQVVDITYVPQNFIFIHLVAPAVSPFVDGPHVFALRTDGAIFGSTALTPGMMLVGGPGVETVPGAGGNLDGEFFDTTWTSLAIDPSTGMIHGLRADGRIFAFDGMDFDASSGVDPGAEPDDPLGGDPEGPVIGPPEAVEVANLPFPGTIAFTVADLYTELAFDTDGTWYVLRQDGAIFRSDDEVMPLMDLPGDGVDSDEVFVDFDVANGEFYALRFDGSLFGNAGTPIVDLQKKRYRSLALGDTAPDLSNFKNAKPVAVAYKPKLVENEAIDLPILITDVNKAADQLDIQVDLSGLPDATWDDVTRTVSWPGGLKGKYPLTVTADDGELKKPKTFKYKISVVPADTNPAKNRPPTPAKVKKVQALVGIEVVLPLLASDRDGDPITITVDDTSGIFTLGATYDAPTATISWTPEFDHLGKQTATVFFSDGIKTKKVKLKFKVVNPLIFE